MTYPTIMPALTLDFQNSQQLDPRVTFSRSSSATYINSAGQVASAADHEARFDHDPVTGECLGLLVEESRTNTIVNSTNMPAIFTATELTATANAGTAPDGTNTAVKLEASANATQHFYQCASGGSASRTYTVFAKADGETTIYLGNYFYVSQGFNFDLTDDSEPSGSFPGSTTYSYTQKNLANGWKRLSYTIDPYGGRFNFIVMPGGNNSNAGTGGAVLIWGPMSENATFPSSLIPTSGSTVTRSQDIAQVTTADIYGDEFTIINKPFGVSSGGPTLHLQGHPHVERAAVYNEYLSQEQINTVASKTDDWWEWRVVGPDFGLSFFGTDGQVTVDWGDGTVETLTTAAHTFTNGSGYHTVKFRLDSGTYFRPQGFNTTTHTTKLKSIGPAPASMVVNPYGAFFKAAGLETFDATVTFNGSTEYLCSGCTSLKSFPFVNYSGVTFSRYAWSTCSSLTSFPQIDTSNSTDFVGSWWNCSSLTSFPALDFSSATGGNGLRYTWRNCSSLTSFPFIDTGTATSLEYTWGDCQSLTSFPLIDTSNITSFAYTWYNCDSLTSFPLINVAAGRYFRAAWYSCNSLTTFPANFFDSWTGTPINYCFHQTWTYCTSLTATSVENILNSIDTSGQSAPSTGVDITISYNASSGTPNITTAVTNLKSRGWTITLNGVAQ